MSITKHFIQPIVVLMAICLVISTALAFTNDVTAPVIEKAAAEKAEAARKDVLPDADSFELMQLSGLPETVTEVYQAANGSGYVFMLTAKGYGGDMNLICGMDADGNIIACKTLSHSETSGLGSKVADDGYRNQYTGVNTDTLGNVQAISGATISSNAYKNAVGDAFAAYELAKEAA